MSARWRRTGILVASCLLAVLPHCAAKDPQLDKGRRYTLKARHPFFLEIKSASDSRTVAHLLGSPVVFHRRLKLGPQVQAAFDEAGALVLGMNPREEMSPEAARSLLRKLYLPEGLELEDVLSAENATLARERIETLDIPRRTRQALTRARPWWIALAVLGGDGNPLSLKVSRGPEIHLAKLARGKRMVGLQSASETLGSFTESSWEDQDRFLGRVLRGDIVLDHVARLKAWLAGDWAFFEAEFADEDFSRYSTASESGNARLTTRLLSQLKEAEAPLFVVIPVGNLVGEHGVLAKLRAEGFDVSHATATTVSRSATPTATAPRPAPASAP